VEYKPVNLERLAKAEGIVEFTPEIMAEQGIIGKKDKVKILGKGEISQGIIVSAHKFSKTARQKIEAAGGKVVEI